MTCRARYVKYAIQADGYPRRAYRSRNTHRRLHTTDVKHMHVPMESTNNHAN